MLLTKSEIENIPLASLQIALQNVSEFWLDESKQRHLADVISQVQRLLFDKKVAGGAILVRYIIVSSNFEGVLSEWNTQNASEETVLRFVDSTRKVDVLGKNYTWGDGTVENTYGVVFLQEYVALALVDAPGSRQDDSAKHILAHELAHSHEQLIRLGLGEPKQVHTDDWPGIKLLHAKLMWAEYIAEASACQCFPDHGLFTVEMFMSIFENALNVMEQAIEEYRTNRNLVYLWDLCASKVSDVTTSLARTIAVNDAKQLSDLLSKITNDNWVPVIESAIKGLQYIPKSNITILDFDDLCDSIGRVVNAFGIYPRKHPVHKLWLDVSER